MPHTAVSRQKVHLPISSRWLSCAVLSVVLAVGLLGIQILIHFNPYSSHEKRDRLTHKNPDCHILVKVSYMLMQTFLSHVRRVEIHIFSLVKGMELPVLSSSFPDSTSVHY